MAFSMDDHRRHPSIHLVLFFVWFMGSEKKLNCTSKKLVLCLHFSDIIPHIQHIAHNSPWSWLWLRRHQTQFILLHSLRFTRAPKYLRLYAVVVWTQFKGKHTSRGCVRQNPNYLRKSYCNSCCFAIFHFFFLCLYDKQKISNKNFHRFLSIICVLSDSEHTEFTIVLHYDLVGRVVASVNKHQNNTQHDNNQCLGWYIFMHCCCCCRF